MKRIYVCNDTVTEFSQLFTMRGRRKRTVRIVPLRSEVVEELFCDYVEVEETEHKARAVEAMICKHLGESVTYGDLYYAMFFCGPAEGRCSAWNDAGGTNFVRQQEDHGTFKSSKRWRRYSNLAAGVGAEAHALKRVCAV